MKTLKKNIVILNVLKMIHKRKKRRDKKKETKYKFIINDVFFKFICPIIVSCKLDMKYINFLIFFFENHSIVVNVGSTFVWNYQQFINLISLGKLIKT